MYSFFKDFGGVIATVIASAVAAWITIRLGLNQAAIAWSQAGIARDKLKFDLFEMRYGIYSSVKELIEYASELHQDAPVDATRVRNLYVKLDEARFFFDEGIVAFIKAVSTTAEEFFSLRDQRAIADPEDTQKWMWFAEQLAGRLKLLRQMYAAAPIAFESSLRFEEVTTKKLGPSRAWPRGLKWIGLKAKGK